MLSSCPLALALIFLCKRRQMRFITSTCRCNGECGNCGRRRRLGRIVGWAGGGGRITTSVACRFPRTRRCWSIPSITTCSDRGLGFPQHLGDRLLRPDGGDAPQRARGDRAAPVQRRQYGLRRARGRRRHLRHQHQHARRDRPLPHPATGTDPRTSPTPAARSGSATGPSARTARLARLTRCEPGHRLPERRERSPDHLGRCARAEGIAGGDLVAGQPQSSPLQLASYDVSTGSAAVLTPEVFLGNYAGLAGMQITPDGNDVVVATRRRHRRRAGLPDFQSVARRQLPVRALHGRGRPSPAAAP